uniref:Cyclin-like protein n=1 Tax=Tanacetum cinerariifolium TaxID=118510 RepID=A0A699H3Z2_TANCI|nr:cyclin-like protein [Tanacetum cinerariifolium]
MHRPVIHDFASEQITTSTGNIHSPSLNSSKTPTSAHANERDSSDLSKRTLLKLHNLAVNLALKIKPEAQVTCVSCDTHFGDGHFGLSLIFGENGTQAKRVGSNVHDKELHFYGTWLC